MLILLCQFLARSFIQKKHLRYLNQTALQFIIWKQSMFRMKKEFEIFFWTEVFFKIISTEMLKKRSILFFSFIQFCLHYLCTQCHFSVCIIIGFNMMHVKMFYRSLQISRYPIITFPFNDSSYSLPLLWILKFHGSCNYNFQQVRNSVLKNYCKTFALL